MPCKTLKSAEQTFRNPSTIVERPFEKPFPGLYARAFKGLLARSPWDSDGPVPQALPTRNRLATLCEDSASFLPEWRRPLAPNLFEFLHSSVTAATS